MSEGEQQQNIPIQDWQKADSRILGQILAAQNVVFTLPDTIRIAEFYAQILITIPGITACRVCMGGKSVQAGEMASEVCTECETLHDLAWGKGTLTPVTSGLKCDLADRPGMRVIAINSYQHHFGFFVFHIDHAAFNALYQPFISNMSNCIALILENRWQKDLLQTTNDELERKVEERTHELTAANEALAASRQAALDMMKEAVEARQRAEQFSADLQYEVAEHKQVEQEYRTLIECVPDLIVRYDLDLRRIYVNPAWEKASGLSAAEVVGVDYPDIPKVPIPVVDEYVKKLRIVLENEASQTVEFTWVNAHGMKLFLEYVIVPEYDLHGRVAGVLAVGRDITDRRQVEADLRESEERFRRMAENAPDMIYRMSLPDGKYEYVSPAAFSLLGYSPEEFYNNDFFVSKIIHPDWKNYLKEQWENLLKGVIPPTYEYQCLHKSGQIRWLNQRNILVHDDSGNPIAIEGIVTDVTANKAAEEEVRQLNQELDRRVRERTAQLESANKELEAFAYSVSHDLRAPLRHIDGFMELLQKKTETALDEQGRQYMVTISGAANKMGLLIDDLLSFSRMGRHSLSFQPVNLGSLVRDVIGELEPDAAGRDIAWRIGDLPAVDGDTSMLRMVLANLIANALKFTRPRQQARIEIGSLPDQASETVIFVRDNGVGFDMAYADKLFGVFQRLHRADEFEGTGIGLANVRRIIARHGGRTWAEGKIDQGASLYFSLPHTPQGGGDN
jgi:PAS domain S-box-containing protein